MTDNDRRKEAVSYTDKVDHTYILDASHSIFVGLSPSETTGQDTVGHLRCDLRYSPHLRARIVAEHPVQGQTKLKESL